MKHFLEVHTTELAQSAVICRVERVESSQDPLVLMDFLLFLALS